MIYSSTQITMELRDVLKMKDEHGKPFDLWDFDYPSYYTGAEKEAFEQKIIDHYYLHQIGFETVARFKHQFKTRMREIMPYYIQLYKSEEIMANIEDPFGNVDMLETFEQETTDNTSGTSTSNESGTSSGIEHAEKSDGKTATDNSTRRFSNTPQGSIGNIDNYLTEATKEDRAQTEETTSSGDVSTSNTSDVNTTGASESESRGTVKHTFHRKGNHGANTYAHDMIEYRQSFINVDMQVIGALRDLFILIY